MIIPRTSFKVMESLRDMYDIDETVLRRFDSSREAFIIVGEKDTGEIGPLNWVKRMFAKVIENVEKSAEGKSRSDYALMMGASAVNKILGTYGDQNANKQFLKWTTLFVPEPLSKLPVKDDRELTPFVKKAALIYGADLVGIAELDREWVYERNIYNPFVFGDFEHPMETEEEFEIPNSINKAVVMAICMNRDLISEPSNVVNSAAAELGYSKMGFLAISLAEFIRTLGYNAIPCMNDTALSIPLAIDAGLGQLGRNGLLLTPEYGACLRLCKVLTDMPLNIDMPIDFGLTEFCKQCLACGRACPADAISTGDRTFAGVCESNNPGVEKWYVNAERCLRFWQVNGAACSDCIAACPFTEGFVPTQCLECERCGCSNGCALQTVTNERLKYGL